MMTERVNLRTAVERNVIRKKPADTLQIWKHYDSKKEQCSNNIQKRYRI